MHASQTTPPENEPKREKGQINYLILHNGNGTLLSPVETGRQVAGGQDGRGRLSLENGRRLQAEVLVTELLLGQIRELSNTMAGGGVERLVLQRLQQVVLEHPEAVLILLHRMVHLPELLHETLEPAALPSPW
jgi:hypothetical protein